MIKDVIKFIHGATTEDINLIIDAIKLRRNQIHTSKAQTFKVVTRFSSRADMAELKRVR